MLAELRSEPRTPISAHDAGTELGLAAHMVGHQHGLLAAAGLARKAPLTPAGKRMVWSAKTPVAPTRSIWSGSTER